MTFQTRPAILAVGVFLILANVVLLLVMPDFSKVENDPSEEIWFVYFAVVYAEDPPEDADDSWLRRALSRLDRDAEPLAQRLEVLDCRHEDDEFELRIRHQGNDRTYSVTRYGVR